MSAGTVRRAPAWLLVALSGALLGLSFPGSGDQGWLVFVALVLAGLAAYLALYWTAFCALLSRISLGSGGLFVVVSAERASTRETAISSPGRPSRSFWPRSHP